MPGVVRQVGAQGMLNHFTGVAIPVVASSSPAWIPGLLWVDTTGGGAVLKHWNGSAWTSSGVGGRYVALLTADPDTSGVGGGPAVNISDLAEVITSGYARQSVTFGDAAASYPSPASNTNDVVFGAMTADMLLPAQWAALVTAASGTSGQLLYTWELDTPQQVNVSQTIPLPIGMLELAQQ